MKGLGWRLEIRKNFCVYCMCSQTETVKEAGRMNTQNMKDTAKGIFTAKRIKIGVAVLVVCAIAAGGGAWYMHQQKMERRAQIAQAQMRMVQYQASERSLNLLDEAKIRSLAAQAVGVDESALTFKKVELENKWDDDDYRKGHGLARDYGDKGLKGPQGQPSAQPKQLQAPAAQGQIPGQPQFFPVYEVEATVNGIEYDMEFNAVTGELLHSEVDHH